MLQGSRESPAIKGYEWFRNKIVSKKKMCGFFLWFYIVPCMPVGSGEGGIGELRNYTR